MIKAMPVFAPHLFIRSGVKNVEFYTRAFGAREIRRFTNDDGSIHVVEFSIGGALFHLHEDKPASGLFSPDVYQGVTSTVGLFVSNVDDVMYAAVAEGATIISPAQDYDYGYRQGEVKDPFGHVWLIEKQI